MKTTVHTRTTSARTRTTRRSSHHIPIGLQIVARAIHGRGWNMEAIKERLQDADAEVVRLLHDPIASLDDFGTMKALDKLSQHFDESEQSGAALLRAMRSEQHDPAALLCDYAIVQQNAGLFLGLCFGFRLATGLGGKDGAQ